MLTQTPLYVIRGEEFGPIVAVVADTDNSAVALAAMDIMGNFRLQCGMLLVLPCNNAGSFEYYPMTAGDEPAKEPAKTVWSALKGYEVEYLVILAGNSARTIEVEAAAGSHKLAMKVIETLGCGSVTLRHPCKGTLPRAASNLLGIQAISVRLMATDAPEIAVQRAKTAIRETLDIAGVRLTWC